MIKKQAETQDTINILIASRWSGRAYDPERGVTRKQLVSLLEAARWAPSCFGDEPWRYIVCNRQIDDDSWQIALTCLVDGNQRWAQNAPVLILVFADSTFFNNDKENRWGQYDTGAASMSICLQATELGLMVHQMGGILAEKIMQSFDVPARFTPMSVMAIGYQLAKKDIPEEMLERELSERKRKPFNDLFFSGKWGGAFSETE